MPNFKTHFVVGAGVGIVLNIAKQAAEKALEPTRKFDLLEALSWGAIGAAAGSLPDILEPARTPNHRGFCHSLFVAGLLLYASMKNCPMKGVVWKLLAVCYLSHLALDCSTKKSLPWI